MQIIAVFFLATAAIGGVVYVFLYPMLSGERKAEQRMQSVTGSAPTTRVARTAPQKSRRDAIESTLKDFDERHKKTKSVPLSVRIARAGLSWSKRQFAIISGCIGLAMFAVGTFAGAGLLVSAVQIGRRVVLLDSLVDRQNADIAENCLAHSLTAAVVAAARRHDHVDAVIRQDEAAGSRFRRNLSRHGTHA